MRDVMALALDLVRAGRVDRGMDAGLQARAARGHRAGPVLRLALLAAVLVAALPLAVRLADPGAGWPALTVATLVLAGVAGLALRAMIAGYPHDRLGACNAMTLLRAALVAGLVAALMSPFAPWAMVGIAVLALALDGVDGWLARREGLASAFGARFDMEVDALLGLVLALLAMAAGKAGPWVLVLGGLRYAYMFAGVFMPWLQGDLPPRRTRKTICVIQIATLIALLAPPVVPPLSLGLAGVASVLLVGSFAVDILWLWRRR